MKKMIWIGLCYLNVLFSAVAAWGVEGVHRTLYFALAGIWLILAKLEETDKA